MESPPDSRGGYEDQDDPYCYEGSSVLRNVPGLREQEQLQQFENAQVALRVQERLPAGRFGTRHYRALHHHLFQDVYAWAGKYRTVRTAKGGSTFCYPENIETEMGRLFLTLRGERFLRDLSSEKFAVGSARFLETLNAIHPFREGNGRTQLIFLRMLAKRAGHPLDLSRLDAAKFLTAMIESFKGNTDPLAQQIFALEVQERQ